MLSGALLVALWPRGRLRWRVARLERSSGFLGRSNESHILSSHWIDRAFPRQKSGCPPPPVLSTVLPHSILFPLRQRFQFSHALVPPGGLSQMRAPVDRRALGPIQADLTGK